jgi:Zn-dependent M28 family amino/carboxypeptidase
MQFDYTVYFMAFDGEEIGIYGSKADADTAYFRGDSIMGVLNLDMISYDGNNDSKFSAIVNPQTVYPADDFIAAYLKYNIGLVPAKSVKAKFGRKRRQVFLAKRLNSFVICNYCPGIIF